MADIKCANVNPDCFNPNMEEWLPYNLKRRDFENTMKEVYDFMYELNVKAVDTGWQRLEDMLPAQSLSGMMSAMLKTSLAKYSRSLVENTLENGFPDLIPEGKYADNRTANGEGVEIKSTNKPSGAVDMHSAHEGWICVFVYERETDRNIPLALRLPFQFSAVFCGYVYPTDYRLNPRRERGTRTATLDSAGLEHFHKFWVYASDSTRKQRQWFKQLEKNKTILPDLARQPTNGFEYDSKWFTGPSSS